MVVVVRVMEWSSESCCDWFVVASVLYPWSFHAKGRA